LIALQDDADILSLVSDPTGRSVAMTIAKGPGAAVIATVNSDGTGYREVYGPVPGRVFPGSGRPSPGNVVPAADTLHPRVGPPAWSQDGQSLMFGFHEDDGSWKVMRVGLTGGVAEVIGTFSSNEFKLNGPRAEGFTVSPDGRRVAYGGFTVTRPTNELWALDVSSISKRAPR
jgi:hypothetical protein